MRTPTDDRERCKGFDGFSRIRYRSRAKADRARIKHPGAVAIYQCYRCGDWHITTKPRSRGAS